jgi:hypothetical protein
MNTSFNADASLISALENWLAECEANLSQSLNEFTHLVGIPRWHVETDGSFRHYPVTPMYRHSKLDQLIFEQSKNWPEVSRSALANENFSKHIDAMIFLPDGSGGTFTLPELCSTLLPRLCMRDGEIALRSSETPADRVKTLVKTIDAETADCLTIWPLTGVAARDPIHLDELTEVREMTVDEKLLCLNMEMIRPRGQLAVPSDRARWFALCRRASGRKRFGQDSPDIAEISSRWAENESVLEDFLAIVPLVNDRVCFHAGGIQSAPHVQSGGILARGVTGRGGASNGLAFLFVDDGAVISDEAARQLKSLWSFMRQAQKGFKARVANAARRSFYAETRVNPEDALIDFMIAAESLYQEGRQELSYKMSLNAALWSDDDNKGKRRVFGTLRQAYGLRSKVVHGDTVSVEEVREAVASVRPLLRAGIRKAVVHLADTSAPPNWEDLIFSTGLE